MCRVWGFDINPPLPKLKVGRQGLEVVPESAGPALRPALAGEEHEHDDLGSCSGIWFKLP